ncbi:MAG: hypothetical protein DRI23_08660, partial [Candidatus Cloacimonadota bacterium]
ILGLASILIAAQHDYNPTDSPTQYAYNSNTYTESGWTDIVVADTDVITDVVVAYTWTTDYYAYEGSFWLESPTSDTVVEIANGEDSGTYSHTLTGFVDEIMTGTWKLWIEDSYGDGGHQATGITVSFHYAVAGAPDPPASLTATAVGTDQIDLAWTQNAASEDVLLAWSADGIFGSPENGTSYAADATIVGGGTVLYNGSTTSYSHMSLLSNSAYYYKAWSLNGSGASLLYSDGIAANAFTDIALPYAETFTIWPPNQWDLTGGTQTCMQYSSGEVDCAKANFWSWSSGSTAYMLSPELELTGATGGLYFFNFDWSHLYSASYPNDALTVSITSDGGANWTELFSKAGENFDSNDGAGNTAPGSFVTESYNVSSYVGETVQFRFYFYSGWGPDAFVDNVELVTPDPVPVFSAAPDPLLFSVEAGTGDRGYIQVSNTGYADLIINSASIIGTDDRNFSTDVILSAITLAPAGTHIFNVDFFPNDDRDFVAQLKLGTNLGDQVVDLNGTGFLIAPDGLAAVQNEYYGHTLTWNAPINNTWSWHTETLNSWYSVSATPTATDWMGMKLMANMTGYLTNVYVLARPNAAGETHTFASIGIYPDVAGAPDIANPIEIWADVETTDINGELLQLTLASPLSLTYVDEYWVMANWQVGSTPRIAGDNTAGIYGRLAFSNDGTTWNAFAANLFMYGQMSETLPEGENDVNGDITLILNQVNTTNTLTNRRQKENNISSPVSFSRRTSVDKASDNRFYYNDYTVYRGIGSGIYDEGTTASTEIYDYVNTPTEAATTYYYNVAANYTAGEALGTEINATTNVLPTASTSPTPADAETGILTTATLSWTNNGTVSDVTVYFDTDDPPVATLTEDDLTSATPTLAANQTYYWKVDVTDGYRTDVNGTVWSFTTVALPPDPVTYIAPADAAVDQLLTGTLSWNSDPLASSYKVYLDTATDPVTLVQNTADLTYSYSVPAYSQTYYWKVVPTNDVGDAVGAAIWSFTTFDGVATTPSPADAATDVWNNEPLDWADVNGALGYLITIGTTSGANDVANAVSCATSDYTHSSAWSYGQQYFWTVTTVDANGASDQILTNRKSKIDNGRNIGGTEWSFTTLADVTITPPLAEGFAAVPPTNWLEAGSGDPTTGPGNIGSADWGTGTMPGGDSDARINLYYNNDQEWLISPSVDLGTPESDLIVELDVAVSNWNSSDPDAMGSDDEVQLLISDDNARTWSNLQTWTAADNLPNSATTVITALTEYSGLVKFAIWATDGSIDDGEDYDFHIDNFGVRTLYSGTDITAYSFAEQTGPATIDAENHTVAVEVALGTSVTALVSTFELSAGATAYVEDGIVDALIEQESGTTTNDFTEPVTYTIVAEDASTQDWTVTVTVATSLSEENDILAYSFPEQTGAATINT